MKRTILIFCCFLLIITTSKAQHYIDTIYSSSIRSVQIWPSDAELETPILQLGSTTQLHLKFDLLLSEPQSFRYRIVHCDRNWNLDDLTPQEYIYGFEEDAISNHQFSFTTIQGYINYYQDLPSDQSRFLASGNYALLVFLQDDPDSIVFTRRFRVAEQLLDLDLQSVTPSEMPRQNQELSLSIAPRQGTDRSWLNPFYLFPYIQQNGRLDLCRQLPFFGYQADRLAYQYKPENIFPGGNCFRFFDFSNIRTPMYHVQRIERFGGETFVMLEPCENLSRKNFNFIEALTGGYKINIWDRTRPDIEADYAWVNISLPAEHPYLDGSIHIVGDLTDWTLGDNSRMEYSTRFKAYTKRLYLKQGYYSYQLLFLPVGATIAETARIEGNHFESPNRYTVFVYGRRPSDRYDHLLAVTTNEK